MSLRPSECLASRRARVECNRSIAPTITLSADALAECFLSSRRRPSTALAYRVGFGEQTRVLAMKFGHPTAANASTKSTRNDQVPVVFGTLHLPSVMSPIFGSLRIEWNT